MSNPRHADHPIDPLFTNRWSPRSFTGESMSQAQLLTLLEAGRWAPSAYNAQPWRFVYTLRDSASWQPILGALNEFNQGWGKQASALVVVASAKNALFPGKDAPAPNPSHSFDAGAAWVSIALQASLSGWAAHALAGFDPAKLREAIALPEDHAIETVIVLGKQGPKAQLPEMLQARETPNDRRPLAATASEGVFRA